MSTQYPLREKRRQASRTALIDAARELFAAQGFAKTTLDEVAELAGLHVQTLYRHFPTKQSLIVVVQSQKFKDAFQARESDTLSFWRFWVEQGVRSVMERDGGPAEYMEWVRERNSDPKLESVALEIQREYHDTLVEGFAKDFGMDPEHDRFPTLIAGMLWSANNQVLKIWEKQGGEVDLPRLAIGAVDEVMEITQHLREWKY